MTNKITESQLLGTLKRLQSVASTTLIFTLLVVSSQSVLISIQAQQQSQESLFEVARQLNTSGIIDPMNETEMTRFIESPVSQLETVRQMIASGKIEPMNETELVMIAGARQRIADDNARDQAVRDELSENLNQYSNYAIRTQDLADPCLGELEKDKDPPEMRIPWDMNLTRICNAFFVDFNQNMTKLFTEHRSTFDEVLYGITQ